MAVCRKLAALEALKRRSRTLVGASSAEAPLSAPLWFIHNSSSSGLNYRGFNFTAEIVDAAVNLKLNVASIGL
jgi:hypothetical protein